MMPSIAEVTRELTAPGQPFEIEEVLIEGRPTRVWKNARPHLRAVFEGSVEAYADRVLLVYEDERLTFKDTHARVAELAHVLMESFGVRKGDRVAIAMRNYPEWVMAFWASVSIGAIVVPLNAWWTGRELEYGLHDSGAKVLFADQQRIERLQPFLSDLSLTLVAVRTPELPSGSAVHMQSLLEGSRFELPDVSLHPDDDATIFYTSGTTGEPKGALGTHRNLITNLGAVAFGSARATRRRGDKVTAPGQSGGQNAMLISVPFFHVTGCHSIMAACTAYGNKLVMMHKWNAERALELIERERITHFGGVPAMVWQVLESPDFQRRDTSSVKSVAYGGAPAPAELVNRIHEHFPKASATNGYGLTETSAIACSNVGDDYRRKPESVGVPIPVCDVKVTDDQGHELPPGEVGELWVKGPNVVRGYWNKPEATAETFSEGWMRTGDIARIDDEGFVYIVDRAKDVIIRGGENIYSVEVEDVLYSHPDVMDAAVFGVPHHVLGEEVAAVLQVRPGASLDSDTIKTYVKSQLAAFKVPAHVVMRNEPLPRNAAGKVLKKQLRSELSNG